MPNTMGLNGPMLISRGEMSSFQMHRSIFWLFYNKAQTKGVCVCVCVCEREREKVSEW